MFQQKHEYSLEKGSTTFMGDCTTDSSPHPSFSLFFSVVGTSTAAHFPLTNLPKVSGGSKFPTMRATPLQGVSTHFPKCRYISILCLGGEKEH